MGDAGLALLLLAAAALRHLTAAHAASGDGSEHAGLLLHRQRALLTSGLTGAALAFLAWQTVGCRLTAAATCAQGDGAVAAVAATLIGLAAIGPRLRPAGAAILFPTAAIALPSLCAAMQHRLLPSTASLGGAAVVHVCAGALAAAAALVGGERPGFRGARSGQPRWRASRAPLGDAAAVLATICGCFTLQPMPETAAQPLLLAAATAAAALSLAASLRHRKPLQPPQLLSAMLTGAAAMSAPAALRAPLWSALPVGIAAAGGASAARSMLRRAGVDDGGDIIATHLVGGCLSLLAALFAISPRDTGELAIFTAIIVVVLAAVAAALLLLVQYCLPHGLLAQQQQQQQQQQNQQQQQQQQADGSAQNALLSAQLSAWMDDHSHPQLAALHVMLVEEGKPALLDVLLAVQTFRQLLRACGGRAQACLPFARAVAKRFVDASSAHAIATREATTRDIERRLDSHLLHGLFDRLTAEVKQRLVQGALRQQLACKPQDEGDAEQRKRRRDDSKKHTWTAAVRRSVEDAIAHDFHCNTQWTPDEHVIEALPPVRSDAVVYVAADSSVVWRWIATAELAVEEEEEEKGDMLVEDVEEVDMEEEVKKTEEEGEDEASADLDITVEVVEAVEKEEAEAEEVEEREQVVAAEEREEGVEVEVEMVSIATEVEDVEAVEAEEG